LPTSTSLIEMYLDDVHVVHQGGRRAEYREEDGQRVMKQSEITVRVNLNRGDASTTVWTCDLSARLRDDQRRLPQLKPPWRALRERAPRRCYQQGAPGARLTDFACYHHAFSLTPTP
jgi:hypothetical protein